MDVLNIDGKFYKFSNKFGEIMLMGFLWTIFSLPIVTIGATTTALYYVCTKKTSGQDAYILRNFLKSFKENFIKATTVFLILLAVLYVIWINIYTLGHVDLGWMRLPTTIVLYFVLMQVAFIASHIFCIIARFENTISGFFKSALLMSYQHFFVTIGNLGLLFILFILSMLFPVMILFFMGFYIYLSSFQFVKMFRKHYLDFDNPGATNSSLQLNKKEALSENIEVKLQKTKLV